jgi:N6-adenosine-specific RNA methylase IME4
VARAERIKDRQSEVAGRIDRVAFDAKKLGRFSLIYADPPWDDDFGANRRSTENHYPTMPIEDILALPVSEIAHEQAMLFLWVTNPMLTAGLDVVTAWGCVGEAFDWIRAVCSSTARNASGLSSR